MARLRERRKQGHISRRNFIKTVSSCALVAGMTVPGIARVHAGTPQKTLKILQWLHFVPAYDRWLNETYSKEWGKKNDTRVIVDNVGMTSLNSRAKAEIAAQKGHDLCMFLWPPSLFEDQVIDHQEIYQECEQKYGKPLDLAVKSTYNPHTKKFYGFADSYVPDPVNYRKDLWDDVGMFPGTWDDIRIGGQKIKKKHGIPLGIGLAPELDSNVALRSIMASFGATVQNSDGNPVLKSRATLEALKFVKALYRETMTDEVFTWDASSNNRQMLAGNGSLTLNAISITRTGENQKIPLSDNIWLTKAPQGPQQRIGLGHLSSIYVIWKFAENIEGAKQFLVDYVGNFRSVFLATQFYNFPCFPRTVADLPELLAKDSQAVPAEKYQVFADVTEWTTNLGYPGHANAAIDEIFGEWIISQMFAQAATGKMTPEDALAQADTKVRAIFKKWKQTGRI